MIHDFKSNVSKRLYRIKKAEKNERHRYYYGLASFI